MMSKHIRMLNPLNADVLVHNASEPCDFYIRPCYVMPCDCAGPGGCNHFINCYTPKG
jgi:hypothetical protein